MAEVTFSVPGMYADHHVASVVEALKSVSGVSSVAASALRKKVTVAFDGGQTSVEKLEAALSAASLAGEKSEGTIRDEEFDVRRTPAA
ncbi:MAG: heavy-metal-associated domain-containing protein [Dehalococcoidia bacterium]|nr:heavy-metal-associated domain-containing protein [Dehalococcoidia bacterium]